MSRRSNQVLVCQHGARHRYAIPRLFEEAGMLAGLYTDSSALSSLGRIAGFLSRYGRQPEKLRALASRIPEGIPESKVFSSDRLMLPSLNRERYSKDLSGRFRQWGLQGADVLYSMYGEEIEFVEWACGQGKKLIVDIFIHPSTDRILAVEHERVFGCSGFDLSMAGRLDIHSKRLFGLADIILCPSTWVKQGVVELSPESEGKIRIVPYGSSLEPVEAVNENPEVGRLLFAGRDPFRKGLHHLADAVHQVKRDGLNVRIRAAGIDSEEINWMDHHREVECLGFLPTVDMRGEFRESDVFVLPSLSEGQAGVLLEAMACGCPVIATRESGVDVLPSSGVMVPAGDPQALSQAITDVVSDRRLRRKLAEGALRQASEFSMNAWKERLVDVVENVMQEPE